MATFKKFPIVSLVIAVAIATVPFLLEGDEGRSKGLYESAREDARTFLLRNPKLHVDSLGVLILEPTWLAEFKFDVAESNSGAPVKLPARMLARSQARLDGLIADAYARRIKSDPAWRFGVLDARTPARNYFAHAFVHENWKGITLSAVVLLLVGITLEMTWGSLLFATFTGMAIPLTAYGFRLLDASSGVPWNGAAGFAGALLGAYFIRGLGGQFTIPAWILLPIWLGVESFVVRGFWIDNLGSVPWATLCAAVGFGALVAGALRLGNVEARSDHREASTRGPNPIIVRAARLRSDGDPYQAFDLIQAAWRDDSGSEEIADAFFSIAVEVGQPEAAAEAILPNLRAAIRKGEAARALEYWLPLVAKECDIRIDGTAAVRLAEALLDAGHPTEALFTLHGALDHGVSSAHAIRIVKIARDLDAGIARRAATVALGDDGLDAKIRADLTLVVAVSDDAVDVPTDIISAPFVESKSQLDRRVSGEHQVVEVTAFPIDRDTDLEISEPTAEFQSQINNEDALAAQKLDFGVLSAEALSSEDVPSFEIDEPQSAVEFSREDSGDVLSHWSGRDRDADRGVADFSDVLDEDFGEEDLLDSSALESHENGFDFGLTGVGPDLFDGADGMTDSDLTPMMDATDELTSPLNVGDWDSGGLQSQDEQATQIFAAPTASPRSSTLGLRSLRALDAVPIAMGDGWLEVDASPRGKSKLPFSRIQSIAMAAVEGLSQRPVLVVDFVLNGSDGTADPIKSIRVRSDRFDPMIFAPGASSPLVALTAWVVELQGYSNANCLPSREFLKGAFARFDSLEAYERDALSGVRAAED